jgi:hypothetical protein
MLSRNLLSNGVLLSRAGDPTCGWMDIKQASLDFDMTAWVG